MNRVFNILAVAAILAGLFLVSRYSYLLFHVLAETFSIVIACAIFIIAWNTRRLTENSYLLFLGVAYLFVGGFDFAHTLSYRGMGVFPGLDADPATQLWIAARYMEGLSLVAVPVLLQKKVRPFLLFAGFGLVFLSVIGAIFLWEVFPACYVEGSGLTPFKKFSEFVICLLFLASAGLLWRRRKWLDRQVLRWLLMSIGFTIASELAFVLYFDLYGTMNLVGHLLKAVSFYFIYKAILETGLVRPYDLLFRELSESELRYRSLFSYMINGVARHRIVYDEQGKPVDYVFLETNQAFEELTGLDQSAVIGKPLTEVIPGIENDPADWIGVFGKLKAGSRPIHFERFSAPLQKWFSVIAYSFQEGEFVTVFEDITERKMAQEALERYSEDLEQQVEKRTGELKNTLANLREESRARLKAEAERSFAQKEVLDAVQKEQQRIGRDLHDTVQGSLAGVRYMIETLQYSVPEENSALFTGLERAASVIVQTIGQVRALAHSLNPVRMKGKGLEQALAALAENTENLFEIQCRFSSGVDGRLPEEESAMHLYYIVREAVNNAMKHAEAGRIDIRLFEENGNLVVTVEDDGVGIPEEGVKNAGMGMRTMAYRASLIGGLVSVSRRPEGGSVVRCCIGPTEARWVAS